MKSELSQKCFKMPAMFCDKTGVCGEICFFNKKKEKEAVQDMFLFLLERLREIKTF